MRRVVLTDSSGREVGPPSVQSEVDRALLGVSRSLSRDIFGDGGPLIVLTEGRKAPPDRRPRNRLSGLAAWLPSAGAK